jgi:hypothetical protein
MHSCTPKIQCIERPSVDEYNVSTEGMSDHGDCAYLAEELAGEVTPHRAAALRDALGISPKKKSAPELVRRTFSSQACERIEDRLPAPMPVQFQVSPTF